MATQHGFLPVNHQENGLINPQIEKDLEALLLAEEEKHKIEEEIKKLAALLHTMKNPLEGIQEFMGLVMDMNGAEINGLSAADNLGADMRSELSAAQGDVNSIAGTGSNGKVTPKEEKEAKQMENLINEMEAFIKAQMGKGKNAAVSGPVLSNLQNAITSIKSAFGKDWGNPKAMAARMNKWVHDSRAKGTYPPELKTVLNGFQTLNQATSAFSTATNTKLQYQTEVFKQNMGVFQANNETWLQMDSTMVRNQKS